MELAHMKFNSQFMAEAKFNEARYNNRLSAWKLSFHLKECILVRSFFFKWHLKLAQMSEHCFIPKEKWEGGLISSTRRAIGQVKEETRSQVSNYRGAGEVRLLIFKLQFQINQILLVLVSPESWSLAAYTVLMSKHVHYVGWWVNYCDLF